MGKIETVVSMVGLLPGPLKRPRAGHKGRSTGSWGRAQGRQKVRTACIYLLLDSVTVWWPCSLACSVIQSEDIMLFSPLLP